MLNCMTTVKEILGAMRAPTPEDKTLVERAYEFAKKAHEGHTRYSGEPYFIHPAAVAKHLAELGMDAETVAAALLHDAIEDAMATSEDVEREFGAEVLFLVEGVTKLGKHKYQGGERHAESLRRLLVATAADVRVLIVKLADRYHNMTTLEHVPPEKRKRIALETLEIYAPLADRLGMGRIRKEFEDMAFPYIDADAYQHAVEVRKLAVKETEAGLAKVQKEVRHALARKGIKDFKTDIRMKGLWSLHQKLKRKGDDITQIHDIAALRIIVPTVEEAYAALGIIHSLWKPLPGEFKDYISVPKPSSGYQSLHTTVMTGEAGIVEMQVRTQAMHEQSEYGIASHGSYKALGKNAKQAAVQRLSVPWIRDLIPNLLNVRKSEAVAVDAPKVATAKEKAAAKKKNAAPRWLTDLAEAHAKVAESSEFVDGLKSDFFSHRIFVFTPRGDVVDLPVGSTPVDFAYVIHSDLGEHMQGARINNKLVSFDTELSNGDIIEIIKSKSAHPTKKWLDYARTSMARRHIRNYLETQERALTREPELKPLKGKKKQPSKKAKS